MLPLKLMVMQLSRRIQIRKIRQICVDDKFLLLWDESHVQKFHQHLNEQHKNIKFTMEIERNDSLRILDVEVTGTETVFSTSTYCIPHLVVYIH